MDRATTLGAGGGTIETGAGRDADPGGRHRRCGRADQDRRGDAGAGRRRRAMPAAPRSPPARCSSATAGRRASIAGESSMTASSSSTAPTRSRLPARSAAAAACGRRAPGTTTLVGQQQLYRGHEIPAGRVAVSADANLGAAAGPLAIDGGEAARRRRASPPRGPRPSGRAAAPSRRWRARSRTAGSIGGAGGADQGRGRDARPRRRQRLCRGDHRRGRRALRQRRPDRRDRGDHGRGGGDARRQRHDRRRRRHRRRRDAGARATSARRPGTLTIAGGLALSARLAPRLQLRAGERGRRGAQRPDRGRGRPDARRHARTSTTTPGGSFDPGIYRVISYGGALTDNGLAVGTIPSPDFLVQTSVAQPGEPRQHRRADAELLGRRRRAEERRRRRTAATGPGRARPATTTGPRRPGAVNAPFTDGASRSSRGRRAP